MVKFPEHAFRPADVYLVQMPYGAVERPSLALSILKPVLERAGIPANLLYANMFFAEEIGIYYYDLIGHSQPYSLAGEWTFSNAAFPDFEPDHNAFFRHVDGSLRGLLTIMRSHKITGKIPDILWSVRRKTPDFIERLAHRILEAGPKIVACSSTFQQQCASLAILRRVKELNPAVVTALGGANCEGPMGLATHEECPWLDYVCSGEGEELFRGMCERVLGRMTAKASASSASLPVFSAKPPEPAGMFGPEHRANNYVDVRQKPPRAKLEDMNQSPMPDYEEYFSNLANTPFADAVKPGLLMETSRGCWWGEVSHCTFCGLNGGSMKYRSKSADQVLHEFTYLSSRWGIKSFEVVDNIFDMQYFKTVLPTLVERQDGYNIFYETKSNLTRAHVHTMADAGIKWLQPGIESLDDDILRLFGKGTTWRQNLQILKWSRDYGIYVIWLFLYDVPGETDQAYTAMAEWLPLISHLQPPSTMAYIQYHRFSPYQMRPEQYNLHISPDRAYASVYPWKEESLRNYAYFWDDYTVEREQIHWFGDAPKRPGLASLYRQVGEWTQAWLGQSYAGAAPKLPPRLSMRSADGRIHIADSRPCRVQETFELDGLTARIYDICDQGRNGTGISRDLSAQVGRTIVWEEIEPLVAQLCADKLMLGIGGHYLSLATLESAPPLNFAHYPGGRVQSAAEMAVPAA